MARASPWRRIGRLQTSVVPRRHRVRRLEAVAEMRQIAKSAGQRNLRNGFPRKPGVEQVAPGLLEPPGPYPLAHGLVVRVKQILKIARRDAHQRGDLFAVELCVTEVALDDGLG